MHVWRRHRVCIIDAVVRDEVGPSTRVIQHARGQLGRGADTTCTMHDVEQRTVPPQAGMRDKRRKMGWGSWSPAATTRHGGKLGRLIEAQYAEARYTAFV